MFAPEDLVYTAEHIWAKVEGDRVRIGLTQYAQSDIGEILLVELPEVGRQIRSGEKFAVIETAKAISDLKSPLSGRVLTVNEDLQEKPELLNKSPYGEGWLILLEVDPSEDLTSMMDFQKYQAFLKEEGAL
ncbi:MAG: glycine cleavage system protein GcvH [bacterium]